MGEKIRTDMKKYGIDVWRTAFMRLTIGSGGGLL
jgi:hypothetical protein